MQTHGAHAADRVEDRPAAGRPEVLLVGGGTVGHLAPGFALAAELRARGVGAAFATPLAGDEARWLPPGEPRPWRAPALRRPGAGPGALLFGPRLAAAVATAHALLRRLAPRAVVGLGGWPCVPTALAAALAHVPLFLLASDERPGLAIRALARLATRVYVAREGAAAALARRAPVLVTGPVLRAEIRTGRRDAARFGLVPGRKTLLVLGGSLGAEAVNRAAAEGILAAVRHRPERAGRLQVLHSVGRGGEGVGRAYAAAGVAHHVTPFLTTMGDAYATADLVLSRAGAVTCAEIEAVGVPAVLVPYPHHADRQQHENAARLVACGTALCLEEQDLDLRRVEEVVVGLLEDEARLARMRTGRAAPAAGGAVQIADDLVRSLRLGPRRVRPAGGRPA